MIRAMAVHWNARDLDAALAPMGDEIVFDWSRSNGLLRGTYRGKEAVREFFAVFFEAWAEYALEIARTQEIGGDIVVTEIVGSGTGAGSGAGVTARGATVCRFDGEQVVGLEMLQSYEDALASVQKG